MRTSNFVRVFATFFAVLLVSCAASFGQQVAVPAFNPNGGWFPTERAVTISCPTAGATIHRTTNGAIPNDSDPVITSGATILVDRPLTITAIASKAGMTTSSPTSASYIISGRVAGGGNHSVVLKSDGTVWAFGANNNGQLGIGSSDASPHVAPLQVKANSSTSLVGISAVAAGTSHSVAVRQSDGSVFGWGNDSAGQLGDNSTATQQNFPVQAKTTATGNPVLLGIVDVAGGAAHTVALKSDGTVWTWGSNASGQLGDGSLTSRKLAAQVKTGTSTFLTGIVAISAGDNFCAALKSDGTVWTWGVNSSGQLGIGSTTTQKFAVQVKTGGSTNLTGIKDLVCGASHILAIKNDGTVWAWGNNSNGQLGNGTTTQAKNPVQVKVNSTTSFTGGLAVAAGGSHTLILKTDRTVYSCGLNSSGQLSIGSNVQQLFPSQAKTAVGGMLGGVVELGAGANHTLFTTSDGVTSGSGLNSFGQAGNSNTTVNPKTGTAITNFFCIAAFADPDNDGLANWQERELGTNPNIGDSDGDSMPDGWEVNNDLDPLVSDAYADPDGDGLTNLYEYQYGTNPVDYFNGNTFILRIVSGDKQVAPEGSWLPQPLVVQTTTTSDVALTNAPVTFLLGQTGGGLSTSSGGAIASSLSLRTDADGKITVYYQQPATGLSSSVRAEAGRDPVQRVTFRASVTGVPSDGISFWLRADLGVTQDADGPISSWEDQSGNNLVGIPDSPGRRPLWSASGAGGLPAVRFTGTSSLDVPGLMAGASEGEMFVLLKSNRTPGVVNGPPIWLGQSRFSGAYPDAFGVISDDFGSDTPRTCGVPLQPLDQFHLFNVSSKTGEWTSRINGFLLYATNNNTVIFHDYPIIGYQGVWFFSGDIAEILIYNRVLTLEERGAVQDYLGTRYAAALTLPAPTNLVASLSGVAQVTLGWSSQQSGQYDFRIERKTSANDSYAAIGTVGASATAFTDNDISPGTEYFYRVCARNLAGDSAYSNEAAILTVPATPANFTASATSLSQATLGWTSQSASAFKLERKTGATATYLQIAVLNGGATSYVDNGLEANMLYYYRLRASNAAGDSAYSSERSVTTPVPPPSPTPTPPMIASIEMVSGNNQFGDPGTFLAQPFKVRVRSASGQLLADVPVSFSISSGFGGLALTSGGQQQQSMVANTNANGEASIYHALPNTSGTSTRTTATAGEAATVGSLVFLGRVPYSPPATPTPTPDPTATPDPNVTPDPNATPTPSPTATPAPPYRYAIIDLGKDVYPKRVNNKGTVLLAGPNPNNANNWGHARWRGGQAEFLNYSGPASSFAASDINDNDVVVGTFGRAEGPLSETEVNEVSGGLRWPADNANAVKISGSGSFHGFGPHTSAYNYRSASLAAINNTGKAYGQMLTDTVCGFLYGLIFVENSAECPLNATTPTQLSDASGENDDPDNDFNSTWTGSLDTITRAAVGHYIGSKVSGLYGVIETYGGDRTGMIDGQSVDFDPSDLNDDGVVVGTRTNGSVALIRSLPAPPLEAIPDVILAGVSPVAVNGHVRPPAAQPSPSVSPQPTPVPAPQMLSWDGAALVLRELQSDQTWFPFGLEDMIPNMNGWEILDLIDINDSGVIVGRGNFKSPANPLASAEAHGFMLVPIKTVYAFFGSSGISNSEPPNPNPDANLSVLNTFLAENRYEAAPQMLDQLRTFDGEHPGAECSFIKNVVPGSQLVRVFTYNCIRADRAAAAVAMEAMKKALGTDGAYVTFNGHANTGAGPAFTLDVEGLAGFMPLGTRLAAISVGLLGEEGYNFNIRPYVADDPENEIVDVAWNYDVEIVHQPRFPSLPGYELPPDRHFVVLGAGSTAYHYASDIRDDPRDEPEERQFTIIRTPPSSAVPLRYKWFFFDACNSGRDYVELFHHGTFFYTTDLSGAFETTREFVRAVMRDDTPDDLLPQLNEHYSDEINAFWKFNP